MLKRISVAFGIAVIVFYTIVFIQLGTIWFFELEAMKELVMLFFFLLATFWAHEQTARFFSPGRHMNLSAPVKAFLEGLVVVTTSLIFCVLFLFIPQYLFIPTAVFEARGIRLMLITTGVLSLFLYYFFERERGSEKLQEEFLRGEQLQKESLRSQLESLKNQVNPHFLFNNLNILGSLIRKDQDQALRFLNQLSDVYRALLDSNNSTLVPLHAELNLARAYIYLLKTRFGENLQFSIDVPDELVHRRLPPTSLQMLLENAVKHNGFTQKKPLKVDIYAAGDMLVVENNLQPRLEQVTSTKIGLQNINSRYEYLAEKQVEVEETAERFIVRLPLLDAQV